MIPSKLFDVLKWTAIIFLPALSSLVAVVCPLWGAPQELTDAIAKTVTAIGTFLGAILCVSTIQYNKNNK